MKNKKPIPSKPKTHFELSTEEWDMFLKILYNPPEPTEALKALMQGVTHGTTEKRNP